MESGPEHRFFRPIASDNRDNGVLHSASHKAFHDRHVGIGIRGEAVAQKLNRELPELCGSPPARFVWAVESVDHRSVTRARVRLSGVPDVLVRGSPRHVPHIFGAVVPGEGPGRVRLGGRICASPLFRDNAHRRVGRSGVREPVARFGCKHSVRVLENTSAGHEPPLRHREFQVVVCVVHVELRELLEQIGIPALHVVVHGHLRVPVPHVVHLAVGALAGPVALAPERVAPGEGEVNARFWKDRLRRMNAHDRVREGIPHLRTSVSLDEGLSLDRHFPQIHATGDLEVWPPHHALRVDVLAEVNDEGFELVG